MKKYRKKRYRNNPHRFIYEAMQLTEWNLLSVSEWVRPDIKRVSLKDWERFKKYETFVIMNGIKLGPERVAFISDWIIKDIKGEFHPCKPDIFEATYEAEE